MIVCTKEQSGVQIEVQIDKGIPNKLQVSIVYKTPLSYFCLTALPACR